MEKNVQRLSSRLRLLVAAVITMLGYIPSSSGLSCLCYNEPFSGAGPCFFDDFRCTGDVCYVHRQLKADGVIHTDWHCLVKSNPLHRVEEICNQRAHNTDTEAYACCSDGDLCNEHLELVLPIELPQVSTTATMLATTTMDMAGSGSGSAGSQPLLPTTVEPTGSDLPETTTTAPVSSPSTLPPSTATTSEVLPTRAVTTPPTSTSLKCFCSTCASTAQTSCGDKDSSRCYVGKRFSPGQDVGAGVEIAESEAYTWGCFNKSEATTKCRDADNYRCCSDVDLCNERLLPPPLKCSCTSGTCPDGQDYVSCGSGTTCYVGLPLDSSSTDDSSSDSFILSCFNQSEAKVKCNDTSRYNCCSSRDRCNSDLKPPPSRKPTSTSAECNSVSGDCQAKEQQNLLPIHVTVIILITVVVLVVVFVFLLVILWVKIWKLKHRKPADSNSSPSNSSESVTTESESLPSPVSTSSPHHYLHVTADEPAFGDSLKCGGSKA